MPREALEECRVLAVDRQEQPSPAPVRRQGELAGRDERLLVREREGDAALERPERHRQAREADDGVQDHVRVGRVQQRRQVAACLHVRDAVLRRERRQILRARGERADLEPEVPRDDVERLRADRAGRAHDRHAPHGAQCAYLNR